MACSRAQYTAGFKRNAILLAEKVGNSAAARSLDINESTIRGWRKHRQELFNCNSQRKGFRGPKKGRFPDLEHRLADFVCEQRSRLLGVSIEMLQCKARELARDAGLAPNEFKASRSWIQKFMRRAGFSLRRTTSICQKLPEDFESKLLAFQRYVIDLRRSTNMPLGHNGNADQTPVYLDMPMVRTVHKSGEHEVRIRSTGNKKNRITVMLACLAEGHKLPPFIIFRRKTIPKEKFPNNVVVRCHEKGWMDSGLVIDWISSVWDRRPGALLHPESILVLDSFRGHLTPGVKEKLQRDRTHLVVIPGGMTSILQPLDVCLNKPFKDRLRQLYWDWIECGSTSTPAGRLKRPSASTVAQWVSAAWYGLPNETVRRAFKKCSISNALDGSEDDLLWETTSLKEESSSDDDSDGDISGEDEDRA
uniref:HTH CENPB-type domain-containing protein n=1 Tax=Amblyomma aureolatum TaxID=187763 RepID=A0A1E1X1Z9_9ACAR